MWNPDIEETLAEKQLKAKAKKALHKFKMTCAKNRRKRK